MALGYRMGAKIELPKSLPQKLTDLSIFAGFEHVGKARTIRCGRTGSMTYGHAVVVCFAGRVDIGKAMLEQGWAVVYRRYLD
jgi:hypothetical protein